MCFLPSITIPFVKHALLLYVGFSHVVFELLLSNFVFVFDITGDLTLTSECVTSRVGVGNGSRFVAPGAVEALRVFLETIANFLCFGWQCTSWSHFSMLLIGIRTLLFLCHFLLRLHHAIIIIHISLSCPWPWWLLTMSCILKVVAILCFIFTATISRMLRFQLSMEVHVVQVHLFILN